MSTELRTKYNAALAAAFHAVERGDRDQAMFALKVALRAANASNDRRYHRAVFRALSFTRRIPAAA